LPPDLSTKAMAVSSVAGVSSGSGRPAQPQDTVSTVIRNVIRQLETPDHLRGRMTGINMVFFQGGPQLGELEAGAVANWFGAPASVVSGGIGCLLATGWIASSTPMIRHYRKSGAVVAAVDV